MSEGGSEDSAGNTYRRLVVAHCWIWENRPKIKLASVSILSVKLLLLPPDTDFVSSFCGVLTASGFVFRSTWTVVVWPQRLKEQYNCCGIMVSLCQLWSPYGGELAQVLLLVPELNCECCGREITARALQLPCVVLILNATARHIRQLGVRAGLLVCN